MTGHDLVVVGASAGGIEAFCQIAAGLPADLPAAILLVVHVGAGSPRLLASIVGNAGPLPAAIAQDGEPVLPGRIYIAPPDLHLLVRDRFVHLSRSARENRTRPAVDPLFRSAARSYRTRTIGVVLTGSLDDGAAGLLSIKAGGGITVVQDPADALFPGMPQAALRAGAVDHCIPLHEMATLLVRLAAEEAKEPASSAGVVPASEETPVSTGLSCPICHGVLWERSEADLLITECRVGHVFGGESLLAMQADELESALWGAVRALEESAATERRITTKYAGAMARRHAESAAAKEEQARLIRRMILGSLPEAVLQGESVEMTCRSKETPPG